MEKKWMSIVLLFLASLMWISAGFAAEHKKMTASSKTIILTPDDLQWKEGPPALPGVKMAILDGDPHKKGFFVMRLKLPAGTKIPSHMHDNVEKVTVISGQFNLVVGDKQENAKVLPAGSYFSLPPHIVHHAWVDEETIIQLATMGPWTMKKMATKE